MIRNLGKIFLPSQDITLKYYILGNDKDGYSVAISLKGREPEHAESGRFTHDREYALKIGKSLVNGLVFPRTLPNILQELEI